MAQAFRTLLTLTLLWCASAGNADAQSGQNGFPATGDARALSASAPAAPPAPHQMPAKVLFGGMKQPAPIAAHAIGGYANGCLAGARALPVDGKAWQAMRLNRNRNWGHPALVRWLERFALDAQKNDGWPGMLVGDMSQPRGGPMLTGHASHQIGLDADIWFTPMPDRRLSHTEREEMSAVSMLAPGQLEVDQALWDDKRAKIIRRAASSPDVERIFVHPAIKKSLCDNAASFGPDRSWLSKVRAYWGHHYHFHVRLSCPKDSASCKPQAAVPGEDGCGQELADWYKRLTAPPKPAVGPPQPPPPPMTVDRMPTECRAVLETGISRLITPASAAGGPAGTAGTTTSPGAASPKQK